MYRKIAFTLILLFAVSCSKKHTPPNLGSIYTESAKQAHIYSNPVIVIPGILGSKLIDNESGRVVWGAFEKDYANPEKSEGARLVALPMKSGVALKELKDEVKPNGALDRVRATFFGIPVELNAYIKILLTLGAGGYYDESLGKNDKEYDVDYGRDHFTCFQFDYDWRRDNVETAKLLHDFILEKKEYVEQKRKELYGIEEEVKFDIVAHSMGGLIARYFLMYGSNDLPDDERPLEPSWEGSKFVDKLIAVGTPNAGSLYVIDDLIEGKKIGHFLPKYESSVIGTMPSLYQLIPRERHKSILDTNGKSIDMYDHETWIQNQWGLADPDQHEFLEVLLPEIKNSTDRKEIAIDHLKKVLKRAKKFHNAIDQKSNPPESLRLYLIAGDSVSTNSVLVYNEQKKRFDVQKKSPGDGTVTRSSALMDERIGSEWKPYIVTPIDWTNVTFFFNDHLGLTKDPSFSDNLLFLLLELPN